VHVKEARDKVLSTILKIPDYILQAEHTVETFEGDLALSDKIVDLNVAILGALEAAVTWLNQNPIGKPLATHAPALLHANIAVSQAKECAATWEVSYRDLRNKLG
jgi:hypothetical protein